MRLGLFHELCLRWKESGRGLVPEKTLRDPDTLWRYLYNPFGRQGGGDGSSDPDVVDPEVERPKDQGKGGQKDHPGSYETLSQVDCTLSSSDKDGFDPLSPQEPYRRGRSPRYHQRQEPPQRPQTFSTFKPPFLPRVSLRPFV